MSTVSQEPVDVESFSEEQLEATISQVSDKIVKMVDKTCEDANALLKVYGLQTKLQIVIQPIETAEDNTGE